MLTSPYVINKVCNEWQYISPLLCNLLNAHSFDEEKIHGYYNALFTVFYESFAVIENDEENFKVVLETCLELLTSHSVQWKYKHKALTLLTIFLKYYVNNEALVTRVSSIVSKYLVSHADLPQLREASYTRKHITNFRIFLVIIILKLVPKKITDKVNIPKLTEEKLHDENVPLCDKCIFSLFFSSLVVSGAWISDFEERVVSVDIPSFLKESFGTITTEQGLDYVLKGLISDKEQGVRAKSNKAAKKVSRNRIINAALNGDLSRVVYCLYVFLL